MKKEQRMRLYGRLLEQLKERLDAAPDQKLDLSAGMATLCALVHYKRPGISWTGFYRRSGDCLVVGPYQGPLACLVLARGEGVCWAAMEQGAPLLVPDVERFKGHIACDSRARSELVLPFRLHSDGEPWGVLDLDSHQMDTFDQVDVDGLLPMLELIAALPASP